MSISHKRRPPTKRNHSVQLDLNVAELSLHRSTIETHEFDGEVRQPEPLRDDRPQLALPIRHVTPEELAQMSRYQR